MKRQIEYLRKNYHGASRKCIHSLTGRIGASKICTRNYECHHCSFDQWLDEVELEEKNKKSCMTIFFKDLLAAA